MKNSLVHVLIILAVLASMAFVNTANAQEIEIANDYYYLRSKNAASTFYGFPSGDIIIAGGTNTLFTTVVSSNSAMGLRVLNNWNYPAAFEVYGSGVVKANGLVLTSDANEKEKIEKLGSQIDKVMQLKTVSYQWKNKDQKGSKKTYGLLAQDLEKIYPDMVFRSDSGEMGIYYIELIPVLLEAMQEQQAVIQKQAASIADIEKRLSKIEKGVAK